METVPPAGAAVPAGVRQPSGNSSGSCGSMKDSNRSNSPRKGVGVEVQHYTTAEELAALLDVTTLNGGNHHNSCYTNDVHNNHMKNSCSAPATSNSTAPQESAAAKSAAHNLHPQSTAPCLPAAAIETKNVAEQQQQQQQSLMNHDAGSTTIAAGTETSVTTGTPGAASAAAQEGRTNSPPPYPTMPFSVDGITYIAYESELQMPAMMELFQKDLSEPYSIYTYRYFIHNWPKLCFLAMDGDKCVGAIVCKLDAHKKRDAAVTADAVAGGQQGGHGQIRVQMRGYIAMLAVEAEYRKRKIASNLVLTAIRAMVANRADEVVLETEITNQPALRLYENLGFVRDKRLFRYYLNGVDAFRLKLWLR